MATVSVTAVLPVSADQAWQRVGGFNTLPDWHPAVVSSELTEGGRVRQLTLGNGASLSERLETYSEAGRSYSYRIIAGPLPLRQYLSTLQVQATAADSSQITWSGQFEAEGVTEAEAEALVRGIYQAGLDHLVAQFS